MRKDRIWRGLATAVALVASLTLCGCTLLGPGGLFGGDPVAAARGLPQNLAILPTVWTAEACDYCPEDLQFNPGLKAEYAELATAFFYEQIGRHPRFRPLDHRIPAALKGKTQHERVAELEAAHELGSVLVSAVTRVHKRDGGPIEPDSPAAATLWAAAVNPSTGEIIWQGTYVGDDNEVTGFRANWNRLSKGVDQKWVSEGEMIGRGASDLVERMRRVLLR